MRSKLARAALWSIAGSGSQYIVVFLLLVYLARVLDPHDFGLMATVAIGLDLGTRIARWGQVELLQQQRYRNDDSRNQSLRLSVAIGLLCALLFVALAAPLGRLYQSRELVEMMFVCAPVFLFSAASSTAEAILRSAFRFKVIAVRNTITTLIGAGIAIILVSQGYGAMTLAIQRVIQSGISAVWVWTALKWRPSLSNPFRWSPDLAREGTAVMAGTLMPLLVPRTVDLFVGLTMGPAQLGLMRVAYRINDFVGQLVVMPLVSLANTQLSTLSDDLAKMRRSYLQLTQASAALMCPALAGLALVAPEAIPILFGPKWTACVPFVQVIGILGAVAPINYYFAPAMMALGQSRLVLRQGLFQVVIGITLALVAAQISLVAIAIAHVVRGTIVSLYNIVDLRRHMGLRIDALLRSMAPPWLGSLAMTIAVVGARSAFGGGLSPLATLLALAAIGGATYAATLWIGGRIGWWPDYAALIIRRLGARAAPR